MQVRQQQVFPFIRSALAFETTILIRSSPLQSLREETLLCNTLQLWISCRITSRSDQVVRATSFGLRQQYRPGISPKEVQRTKYFFMNSWNTKSAADSCARSAAKFFEAY
jgi:hypothetical protein